MHTETIKYEIVEKIGIGISKEEYRKLIQNHPFIGEKLILDLVNGVGVVAKDLNDSARDKEKGIARVWDTISGNEKKRQNLINENFIYGFNAISKWLQDHDGHLSRADIRIKDIADELYNTQDEIIKFYEQFKEVDFRVELLENFRNISEKRFNEIEKKLANIEAQQQIDREVAKIGTLKLPIELEVFTILDNLASGEFGMWYALSKDKKKKNEQLKYLKNTIKGKVTKQQIENFIDFYSVHKQVKELEVTEQKALAFISSQYREFNDDKLYDAIDIVKLVTTINNRDELEDIIDKNSHISTFMTLEDFISDTTEYVLDFNSKKYEVLTINNDDTHTSMPEVHNRNKKVNLNHKITTSVNNREKHTIKLGIVLSGGGAKGAYEVGFLKALAELDIQPEAIAGTSIGALNGAIYSAKKDTKVSAELLKELWNDLANSSVLEVDRETAVKTIIDVVMLFVPASNVTKIGKILMSSIKAVKSTEGILTQAPLINRLEELAPARDLKNGLPFHIGLTKSKGHAIDTYNFLGFGDEETVYKKIQSLEEEEIHNAIIASASLPILFDSVEVEGEVYSDGCLSSTNNEWGNTPAKPLIEEEGCTHIIVCHLNEGSFFNRHDPLFNNIPIIEVRPKANTFTSGLDPLRFSVDKIDKWINQGYEDSMRIISESFRTIQNVELRKRTESSAEESVYRLKNRHFSLS